jgi:hypothetical protein
MFAIQAEISQQNGGHRRLMSTNARARIIAVSLRTIEKV